MCAVNISSLAMDGFVILGRSCVPPAPGITASLVSTKPSVAFDEAILISAAKAISKPPPVLMFLLNQSNIPCKSYKPKAAPSTAAITGTGML